MTYSSPGNRPTKNQRREQAREKAREHRLETQKKERRRKVLIQGGVVAGILAVVAIVGLVIWSAVPAPGPRPTNMASDGILLQAKLDAKGVPTGDIEAVLNKQLADGAEPQTTKQNPDVLNIVLYQDYQCPICKEFESTYMSTMEEYVRSGAATLEIHPIGMLDRGSTNQYSSRATNAAACVATYDPNNFLAFNALMYANQPKEDASAPGPDNSALKDLVKMAGVKELTSIDKCIDDFYFKSWVAAATDRVTSTGTNGKNLPNSNKPFQGTPTVIVDGEYFNPMDEATQTVHWELFPQFLQQREAARSK